MNPATLFSGLLAAVAILPLPACKTTGNGRLQSELTPNAVQTVAVQLEVPWGLDLLPDGQLLFTERNGNITSLNLSTGVWARWQQRSVKDQAEGGLLGLAVHPDYQLNGYIFIYETTEYGNRVVRLTCKDQIVSEEKVLLQAIPHSKYHDGGILRFGPDGYLYVGTGDARKPELAQDLNSLAGKVLRIDTEGNPAPGNPFQTAVYSYGHRNVQGLAWMPDGTMFATEHGPSGELNGWCCHDELNKIVAGGNYGWPMVIGQDTCKGCLPPVAHSGTDTWAPGGLLYVSDNGPERYRGKLLMACLRGQQLLVFDGVSPQPEQVIYKDTYQRLRNLIELPDGRILMATSNRDGRAALPDKDDDRLLIWQ